MTRIQNFLDKIQVKYYQEYPLNNSKQRFDFFLPEYNMAIEYNGRQHYEFVPFFIKIYKVLKNIKIEIIVKKNIVN